MDERLFKAAVKMRSAMIALTGDMGSHQTLFDIAFVQNGRTLYLHHHVNPYSKRLIWKMSGEGWHVGMAIPISRAVEPDHVTFTGNRVVFERDVALCVLALPVEDAD